MDFIFNNPLVGFLTAHMTAYFCALGALAIFCFIQALRSQD